MYSVLSVMYRRFAKRIIKYVLQTYYLVKRVINYIQCTFSVYYLYYLTNTYHKQQHGCIYSLHPCIYFANFIAHFY